MSADVSDYDYLSAMHTSPELAVQKAVRLARRRNDVEDAPVYYSRAFHALANAVLRARCRFSPEQERRYQEVMGDSLRAMDRPVNDPIPAEEIPRLLEIFARLDPRKRTK